MASDVVKCNTCNIVINELLAFIQNKMDVMDNLSLIRICTSAFSEEDIVMAKDLLFDSVTTTKRKVQRKKDGKSQRDVEDIICVMNQIDQNEIPIFVARNLTKLPPVTFDHVDVTRLLKDIVLLQKEVTTIKQTYVKSEDLNLLQNEVAMFKNADKTKLIENINVSEGRLGEELSSHDVSSLQVTPKNVSASGTSDLSCEQVREVALMSQTEKTSKECVSISATDKQVQNIVSHPGKKSFADVVSVGGVRKNRKEDDNWQVVQRRRLRNRFHSEKGEATVESSGSFRAADVKIPLSADIVALQETWLMPHDLPLLGTIDPDFGHTGTSAVDTSTVVAMFPVCNPAVSGDIGSSRRVTSRAPSPSACIVTHLYE
ncbi:hypothetical protein SFRURICE_000977 [Spodoptera frugiperda]|nr:hypothetical protein SFRURICE_000977 [Spodoptera frugiperda]